MDSIVVGNLKALLSLDTTNFDKGATSSEANAKKLAKTLEKDLVPSQQRINSLIRDFAGNKDIARALEMATAVQKVGGAAKLTASEQERANRVVQEALEKYRVLGIEAPKHLQALATATAKVKAPTETLSSGITGLLGKATSMAGLFGVTLGAGAMLGFAKSVIDSADQIVDLSQKMGVSVEAAQRFQYAARQSGADIGDVSRAIVTMNNQLAEGDKSTVSALGAVGLKFDDIRAMKPEAAFRAIADAIGQIQDPMRQTQIAMDLFGKSGAEVLPMIRDGSLAAADGIRVMSEDTAKRLESAKQSWQNFWDGVTIITGNALASMSRAFTGVIDDMEAALSRVERRQLKPRADAKTVKVTDIAQLKNMTANMEVGAVSIGLGSLGVSLEEQAKLKEAHDKEVKRLKELAEEARRVEEAYAAFRRERLTGLSDAERQRRAFEARFMADLGLTGAFNWSRGIVSRSNLSALLGPGIDLGFGNKPLPSMALPMPATKARGPIGLEELMAGANIPAARLATLFGTGVGGAMNMLPQTILAALQGGGNVGKSIGAMLGGNIGTGMLGKQNDKGMFTSGFGKQWQGLFGGKVGGAVAGMAGGIASMGMSSLMTDGGGKGMMSNIGSYAAAGMMFGPWGAAIGAGVGAIVGAFKKGANNTKKAREEFAKELGFEGANNLYDKLRKMGPEGEKLVNTALNVIGKNDTAAQAKWMKDVTAFFDRLEKVPGKVNELSQALGKFGGAIPQQLDPLLDSILANSNLSPELRKQLMGMRTPAWQQGKDLAAQFGISEGALGGGFNQSRIADSAFGVKRAVDFLTRFEGSDRGAILRDVADELSVIAADAQKNEVALPEAVRDFIRQVDEMGLLIDENGNRIDFSLLRFADIKDEYEQQVVSLLEDIRDLLAGTGPGGSQAGAPSLGLGRIWNGYDSGLSGPIQMPAIDGASGVFMDTAGLSAGAVMDPTAGGTMTFVLERDGRAEARFVAPYLPGETQRLRLAP